MINTERVIKEFLNLLNIESPSKKEGEIASYLSDFFKKTGYEYFFDNSSEKTGSEVGNLIVKIPGTISSEPIFFNAHMDTVGPYENPKIIFENGVFRSDGRTILGADDKSGIVILLEIAQILKENSFPHPPLEFIFTTCEEIGLLGAKYLDMNLIESKEGFILDSELPEEVINGAPSSYQYKLEIIGKSAHAGLEPEKGINSIHIASKILSKLPCGRLDEETTSNIGIINGGEYVNIVPEKTIIEGEMRSHNEEKLEKLKKLLMDTVDEVIKNYPQKLENLPKANAEFKKVFQSFYIPPSDPMCVWVKKAGERIGLNIYFKRKEGASDANVFNEKGLKCLMLGTGMQKVHTTEEYIELKELIKAIKLILELIKIKGEMVK